MADVGYIRVSSPDQNTSRQLESLNLDKIFVEKESGGKAISNRPGLMECLNYLREGDVLHVHSLDRLARNLTDLQSLVTKLAEGGVSVHFHKENMRFEANAALSPMQLLIFQCLGAFAQFERAMIRERQREGIAAAKAEGRHLGRPAKLSEQDKQLICARLQEGATPALLAEEYSISKSTVYNLKREKRSDQW